MLTINGVRQSQGRSPNTGYWVYERSGNNHQFTDDQLTGNWLGADVVVRKNHTIIDKGPVTAQSGTTLTYAEISNDGHTDGWGYFLKNSLATLDQPGEWAFDPVARTITVSSVGMPGTVKASTTGTLVAITGKNDLVFSHLAFEGANEFAFALSNASNVSIQDCVVSNSGSFAFSVANGSNVSLENSTIEVTNNVAISVRGTSDLTLVGNAIRDTGVFEGMGNGLGITNLEYTAISLFAVNGALVERNRVTNSGYNGIHFTFCDNVIVRNNTVDRFNVLKDDGGGIYTWNGGEPEHMGLKVLGNIVLNGQAAPEARPDKDYLPSYGIYMDDNAGNVELGSNTVANCAGSGFFLHNAHNLNIHDNLAFNNGSANADPAGNGQIQFLGDSSNYLIRGITLTNNTFVARVADQIVLKWDTNFNDVTQFGSANNNIYARPIDDTLVARIIASGTAPFYSVSGWKTYSGQDANSRGSARTVNNAAQIRFEYNDTPAPVVVTVTTSVFEVSGTPHTANFMLPAFSSVVLLP